MSGEIDAAGALFSLTGAATDVAPAMATPARRPLATLPRCVCTAMAIASLGADDRLDASSPLTGNNDAMAFDVFICHASEDKAEVARPLANALRGRGLVVWLDEFELKIGDSLRRKIDEGTRDSGFGVVILSPAFFAKPWPQYELDALVGRENTLGSVVVLPVWHRVNQADVARYSPALADKIAAKTSDGLESVVDMIMARFKASEVADHRPFRGRPTRQADEETSPRDARRGGFSFGSPRFARLWLAIAVVIALAGAGAAIAFLASSDGSDTSLTGARTVARSTSASTSPTTSPPPTTAPPPPPPPTTAARPVSALLGEGDRFVFAHSKKSKSELVVFRRNGQTTMTHGHSDMEPALSPDGRTLAFTRRYGRQLMKSNVYLVDLDNGRIRRLTASGEARSPSWSPDGHQLVFTGPGEALWIVRRDGTGFRSLLRSSLAQDFLQGYDAPAWSPDGKTIAYVNDGGISGTSHIYLISADGSDRRRLTRDTVDESSPRWSPDGKEIAYVRGLAGESGDIFVASADGRGRVRALTDDDVDDVSPAWSPRGGTIAFLRKLESGRYGVFQIKAMGRREPAKRVWLVSDSAGERALDWR